MGVAFKMGGIDDFLNVVSFIRVLFVFQWNISINYPNKNNISLIFS